MAITASQITSSQTLEEFRLEFNKLQSDITILLARIETLETQVSVLESE